ncbi:unnamed protein product [Notodromas monacha]|uniref:Transmembrane protein 184C n=1 Tax=Notodromas monacha TaxID=399045 RepID=A0A7R9BK33_9CRUS|nr:unnamed protein product [Notodromas monacha]CAG0916692.1 unnamed protein product [Notodromas monacha]
MTGTDCKRSIGRCLLKWRSWIRPAVMTLYASAVFFAIPFLVVNLTNSGINGRTQLWLVSLIFCVLTIPLTMWEIIQHLIHYTRPELQKHIIRILWMVPIYSLNAWLGITAPDYAIYMDTLRECYEAYVIYNFMIFLLNFLNAEMSLAEVLETKAPVGHIFPLCCLPTWEMGAELIHRCKHGILQYTVVRPITTVVSLACALGGDVSEHIGVLSKTVTQGVRRSAGGGSSSYKRAEASYAERTKLLHPCANVADSGYRSVDEVAESSPLVHRRSSSPVNGAEDDADPVIIRGGGE